MYSVTKEISFDAAHRLVLGYQGKCANIHGHTWRARFHVHGDALNEVGMLFDFNEFSVMKKWIDDNLDHACIVSSHDEALNKFLHQNGMKLFVTPGNPTSEELARILFEVAKIHRINVSTVEVDETCTCTGGYSL